MVLFMLFFFDESRTDGVGSRIASFASASNLLAALTENEINYSNFLANNVVVIFWYEP